MALFPVEFCDNTERNKVAPSLTELTPVRQIAQVVILLSGLILAGSLSAEDRFDSDIQEYMKYHLGRWVSNTRIYDADGKVAREFEEGYGESVLIDGQVNLHFSYNSDGSTNTAFRFHSPEDDKFYMIDVTHEGRWWVLSQERGAEYVYSQEKNLPDGRRVVLRIRHFNVRPGAFEATAHVSFDSGTTWRLMSHQDYRKIGDDPAR